MAKDDEGYLMGEKFIAEWRKFKRYIAGMMKAKIPGGKNTPEGPVFADLRGEAADHGPPPPDRVIWFKLSTDASGGGKYNCKSVTLGRTTGTLSATGNAAESDVGTVSSTEDLLCINTREIGESTHDLDSAALMPLIFWGMLNGDTTSDGKRGVVFDGLQWEDC